MIAAGQKSIAPTPNRVNPVRKSDEASFVTGADIPLGGSFFNLRG